MDWKKERAPSWIWRPASCHAPRRPSYGCPCPPEGRPKAWRPCRWWRCNSTWKKREVVNLWKRDSERGKWGRGKTKDIHRHTHTQTHRGTHTDKNEEEKKEQKMLLSPGGEGVTSSVLDVDDVERSGMLFTVHDDADTPQVTASSYLETKLLFYQTHA